MRNRLIVSKTSIIAVILFLTQFVTLPYFAWYNVLKYMSIILLEDILSQSTSVLLDANML